MFEGSQVRSVLFVYCCGDDTKVKDRMMYSAAKAGVLGYVEGLGVVVDRKVSIVSTFFFFFEFKFDGKPKKKKQVETSDAKELSEAYLHDEVHPKKHESKLAFKRPMRPGAGRARLVGNSGTASPAASE
jgi:hypothetical protein